MQWLVTSQEDIAVLEEMKGASDRAIGIIAASLVEIHLLKLIKQTFITETKSNGKETTQETMFRSSGPLGSFSSRIQLAYIMGLISAELFKDLTTIKDIRNRFAHYTEMGSFKVPEISSRCFHLTLVDKYIMDPDNGVYGDPSTIFAYQISGAAQKLKDPKERYILGTQIISMGIQHGTVNPKPYTPEF